MDFRGIRKRAVEVDRKVKKVIIYFLLLPYNFINFFGKCFPKIIF